MSEDCPYSQWFASTTTTTTTTTAAAAAASGNNSDIQSWGLSVQKQSENVESIRTNRSVQWTKTPSKGNSGELSGPPDFNRKVQARTTKAPVDEKVKDEAASPRDPWDLAVEEENELQKQKHKTGLILNDAYVVGSKIGFGTYGSIYMATDLKTNEHSAVKFELPLSKNNPDRSHSSNLKHEVSIYELLAGGEGIPSVHWSGSAYGYNIMVMELLGPNLEELLQFCSYKMSVTTTLMLGAVMLERLEYIHSKGILHRDIKPANFLIGLNGCTRRDQLFLIDYGLAKSYNRTDSSGMVSHMEYRDGRSLVGTARYASINAHQGYELSRRDDLEALGYLLISLICGSLPWQDLKTRQKHRRYKQMCQMKLSCAETLSCNKRHHHQQQQQQQHHSATSSPPLFIIENSSTSCSSTPSAAFSLIPPSFSPSSTTTTTTTAEKCENEDGSGGGGIVPQELFTYLKYCQQGLAFAQTPDYDYLRSLFVNPLLAAGIDPTDYSRLDWNVRLAEDPESRQDWNQRFAWTTHNQQLYTKMTATKNVPKLTQKYSNGNKNSNSTAFGGGHIHNPDSTTNPKTLSPHSSSSSLQTSLSTGKIE